MNDQVTYAKIEADLIEEFDEWWADEGSTKPESDVREWIDNAATEAVPVMTTVLFGLAVEDNSLAFEEAQISGDEPFAVLADAVHSRLERKLVEHYEAIKS